MTGEARINTVVNVGEALYTGLVNVSDHLKEVEMNALSTPATRGGGGYVR